MGSLPQPSDDFEDRAAKAGDYAEAWIFDKDGPVITGRLARMDERTSEFGQAYPILTIELANGELRSVHSFDTVLLSQLGKANPKVGERLGIRRHAEKKQSKTPGRGAYWPYTVIVEGREGGSVDLSKYAALADELKDGEEPAQPDDGSRGNDDDDIPF